MYYFVSLDVKRYTGQCDNIAVEHRLEETNLVRVLEWMADRAVVEMQTNPVKQLTITVSRI